MIRDTGLRRQWRICLCFAKMSRRRCCENRLQSASAAISSNGLFRGLCVAERSPSPDHLSGAPMRRFPHMPAAGLCIALLFQAVVLYHVLAPWTTPDSPTYSILAQALANGSLHGPDGAPDTIRSPGYPAWLYFFRHIAGLSDGAIIALQLALYLGAIGFGFLLAERERSSGAVFVCLALVTPSLPAYCAQFMAEAPAVFLMTLLVWMTGRRTDWRVSTALAVGLVAGLLVMVRADLLPMAMLCALLAGWKGRHGGYGRSCLLGAVVLLGATAVSLPYMVRNARLCGIPSPVPVTGAVGYSLYLSTWEPELPSRDLGEYHLGIVSPRLTESGYLAESRRLCRVLGVPENTCLHAPTAIPAPLRAQGNRILFAAAMERIRAHPAEFGKHVAWKWWRLFQPEAYPEKVPSAVVGFLRVTGGIVWILAFGHALFALWQRRDAVAMWLAAVLLVVPLPHLVLHTEARYTAAVRLVLLLHATFAITRLRAWRRMQRGLAGTDASIADGATWR